MSREIITYWDKEKTMIHQIYQVDEQNRPDGTYRSYYKSRAKHMECTLTHGAFDGLCLSYHENGNEYVRCSYKNGVTEGEYISRYENGQVEKECNYHGGVLHGPCKKYTQNGEMIEEKLYVNGLPQKKVATLSAEKFQARRLQRGMS